MSSTGIKVFKKAIQNISIWNRETKSEKTKKALKLYRKFLNSSPSFQEILQELNKSNA